MRLVLEYGLNFGVLDGDGGSVRERLGVLEGRFTAGMCLGCDDDRSSRMDFALIASA